jgi:hypothetical protein
MRRYYFDTTNGHRLVDPSGTDCKDDADAIERARVITLGVSLDKPMEDSKRHIAIINDEGQEISRVPINSQPLPGPSRRCGRPLSRSRTAEPSALAAGSVPGIEIA